MNKTVNRSDVTLSSTRYHYTMKTLFALFLYEALCIEAQPGAFTTLAAGLITLVTRNLSLSLKGLWTILIIPN